MRYKIQIYINSRWSDTFCSGVLDTNGNRITEHYDCKDTAELVMRSLYNPELAKVVECE
jgi:hypothetical protein